MAKKKATIVEEINDTSHLVIIHIGDNMVRILAEDSYKLYNTKDRQYYSEAIVKEKEIKNFIAVKEEE